MQSCKDDFLAGLSHTQADANLVVFSASGPSNDPPGKTEIFRNYKMSTDEELPNVKGVFKGKGDFEFRKATQLGVLTTNYNILNYKVEISTQGSNYRFDNTNLYNTLQEKLPGLAEAADKGSEAQSSGEDIEGDEEDKVRSLMELYRTISNDIIELQTKAIIDYCMLSDYFLKIRSEMTANEIPVSLSQFSAYSDIDQPDEIKNELNNLVKLYTQLFTFATPPAPTFPTIVPNKDYLRLNLVVKTVTDNQTINTPDPIDAIIVGGWRHSISGNFLLHRLLDEEYFLTDGEILQEEDGSFVTKKQIQMKTVLYLPPVLSLIYTIKLGK